MEKVKVFISGDRGFIGSNLKSVLSNDVFDPISFEGNLNNFEELSQFLEENKPDVAVHLAGLFAGSFEELISANVLTTQNLLSACNEVGIKKVVYTSTGAVYGDHGNRKYFESDEAKPTTLYGLSKLMAEDLLVFHERTKNISTTILRFPNVYSKSGGKGVISSFIKSIQDKHEVTIAGDGEQKRDFLHVLDACESIKLSILSEKSGVFNISSNLNLSLNQVVEKLKEKYIFNINRVGKNTELDNLSLNFEKASQLLNYTPKINDLDF